MRNNLWLENRLQYVWNKYFSDIERKNQILIRFGKKARTRLGSIKLVGNRELGIWRTVQKPDLKDINHKSLITITGYFADEKVPEFMIDFVIAHELCHYAHGFSSPHAKMFSHPHRGGVVDKELKNRGFDQIFKMQKKWIKEEWPTIIGNPKIKIRNSKQIKSSKLKAIRLSRLFRFFN